MTRPHAPHVVDVIPVKTDSNLVLAVDRKVVAHADTTAGPEGKVLAHPIVLE